MLQSRVMNTATLVTQALFAVQPHRTSCCRELPNDANNVPHRSLMVTLAGIELVTTSFLLLPQPQTGKGDDLLSTQKYTEYINIIGRTE